MGLICKEWKPTMSEVRFDDRKSQFNWLIIRRVQQEVFNDTTCQYVYHDGYNRMWLLFTNPNCVPELWPPQNDGFWHYVEEEHCKDQGRGCEGKPREKLAILLLNCIQDRVPHHHGGIQGMCHVSKSLQQLLTQWFLHLEPGQQSWNICVYEQKGHVVQPISQ